MASSASCACFIAQPHTASSLYTKAWRCLNVYPLCTSAHQTWCCCRRRYASFNPRQHLILWAGLISVIIRCSGCFHMLWHSTATDVVELTCCLLHGECQRCIWTSCGFHALYGHETQRGLQSRFRFSKWIKDGFNRIVYVCVKVLFNSEESEAYSLWLRWGKDFIYLF